jgi:hypothetical protein
MTKNLSGLARKMCTRAKELGLVSATGAPLTVDVMRELIAAGEGYRNAHAYRAALAGQERPALEQEYPDEAGNDYKLVSGTGCWIAMGKFSVHPYLTSDGVCVDIFPRGASQEDLASVQALNADAQAILDRIAQDNAG